MSDGLNRSESSIDGVGREYFLMKLNLVHNRVIIAKPGPGIKEQSLDLLNKFVRAGPVFGLLNVLRALTHRKTLVMVHLPAIRHEFLALDPVELQ